MLGDTAVAVHPDDARYKALIGKRVVLPLIGRRDPDHRGRIFRSGERHRRGQDHAGARLQRLRGRQAPPEIGLINIFDTDGTSQRQRAGANTRGLIAFAARKKVVADLEALA